MQTAVVERPTQPTLTWNDDAPDEWLPPQDSQPLPGSGAYAAGALPRWWENMPRGEALSNAGWECPCWFAMRYGQRLRGLIGVPAGEMRGVFAFPDCRSVHTFGMDYDIDVLLLDAQGHVVKSQRSLAPRSVLMDTRAYMAVERESSPDPWPLEGEIVLFTSSEIKGALSSAEQA